MHRVIVVAAVSVLCPAVAAAQQPASSFSSLDGILRTGDRVEIVDSQGRELSGRITDLSSTSISVDAEAGSRRLAEADVALIRHRRTDSVWNGTLAGLAIGGGLGLLMEATCTDDSYCGEAQDGQMLLGGVVWGTGIGLLVDVVRKTPREVYRAGPPKQVQVGPMLGRGSRGAVVTWRW